MPLISATRKEPMNQSIPVLLRCVLGLLMNRVVVGVECGLGY